MKSHVVWSILTHEKTHVDMDTVSPDSLFHCEECGKSFLDVSRLKDHQKVSLSLNIPLSIYEVTFLRLWPFFYSVFLSSLE